MKRFPVIARHADAFDHGRGSVHFSNVYEVFVDNAFPSVGVAILLRDGSELKILRKAFFSRVRIARDASAFADRLLASTREYWRAEVERSLKEAGRFRLAGVTLGCEGWIEERGRRRKLDFIGFELERDDPIIRLKFGSDGGWVEWRAGPASEAIADAVLRIRSGAGARPEVATEILRIRARERISSDIRDIACLLARTDVKGGWKKLSDFLERHELPRDVPAVFERSSTSLLVNKSFLQEKFGRVIRYYEKNSIMPKLFLLYRELVQLAEVNGGLTAKQMFAIYEMGLYLSISMQGITDVIKEVTGGLEPFGRADDAPAGAERENFSEKTADKGRENACEPPRSRLDVPLFLRPMMETLQMDILADEKQLRTAWTAKVFESHPDRLPVDAPSAEREKATEETARYNAAYTMLLAYVRSGG